MTKTKHSTQLEEQEKASQKIAELEEKTMSLLATVARSEEARSEAHEALLQAEEEKTALAEVRNNIYIIVTFSFFPVIHFLRSY